MCEYSDWWRKWLVSCFSELHSVSYKHTAIRWMNLAADLLIAVKFILSHYLSRSNYNLRRRNRKNRRMQWKIAQFIREELNRLRMKSWRWWWRAASHLTFSKSLLSMRTQNDSMSSCNSLRIKKKNDLIFLKILKQKLNCCTIERITL